MTKTVSIFWTLIFIIACNQVSNKQSDLVAKKDCCLKANQSELIKTDNLTALPAEMKLLYSSRDSGIIGRITHAFLNDSITVSFYGKLMGLPMTKDDDLYSIKTDSVTVTGAHLYQKIGLTEEVFTFYVYKKSQRIPSNYSIMIYDVNRDNFPDIAIYNSVASGNQNHTFDHYIFNPKKNLFQLNYSFSVPNLTWDEKSQTYSSFGSGGRASRIYNLDMYKVINDSLKVIGTITQNYDRKLDKYIRISKKLNKTVIDTLSLNELE